MLTDPLRRTEIFEEPSDRDDADVVLALTERCPFSRQHADDRDRMPVELDDFPDGRLVREKRFSIIFPIDDHAARKVDILVREVAAVGEGVGVRGEEALVRTGDRQAGRCFLAVVNRLAIEVESLQANLRARFLPSARNNAAPARR